MKNIFLFISFLAFTGFSQTKEELVKNAPKDSVITYEGEGKLGKGNCVFVKFTGDPQLFFNELALYHVQDEDNVERTASTLIIYETTKPYWVYGRYSVFASLEEKSDYTYIEVYFKAYANPENYRMYGADRAYQQIIDRLLKQ